MMTKAEKINDSLTTKEPDTIDPQLASRYRKVLTHSVSLAIMADTLVRLDLFSTITTEDDASRHNVAIELLALTGVLGRGTDKMVYALLNIGE